MASNWAKKEEFTVGWGFYPNNNTSAPYGAQTLVLSGFQGGGGATRKTRSTQCFQPHHSKCILFTRTKQCKALNVLSSYSLNVFTRNTS